METNKYEIQENCLIIYMPKEIDHHEAKNLGVETDTLIDAYHIKRLILDFSQTVFMDSAGIGVVIGRCKRMGYTQGTVIAIHLSEQMKKIFRVSGLQKLMEIAEL